MAGRGLGWDVAEERSYRYISTPIKPPDVGLDELDPPLDEILSRELGIEFLRLPASGRFWAYVSPPDAFVAVDFDGKIAVLSEDAAFAERLCREIADVISSSVRTEYGKPILDRAYLKLVARYLGGREILTESEPGLDILASMAATVENFHGELSLAGGAVKAFFSFERVEGQPLVRLSLEATTTAALEAALEELREVGLAFAAMFAEPGGEAIWHA